MRTREIFELPGQRSTAKVANLFGEKPRSLTLVGKNTEIALRIICLVLCLTFAILLVDRLFTAFVQTANQLHLCAILAIIPIATIGLPWMLGAKLVQNIQNFNQCKAIYENGELATGSVVMLSYVSGNDYACYFAKSSFRPSRLARRVRIDYTFNVNNELRQGSVFLKEKNARFITVNADVCVVYDPEDPTRNMLYPIPGEELCSQCLKQ